MRHIHSKLTLVCLFALFSMASCKKDPVACFVPSAREVLHDQPISFINCSKDADEYRWEFGDGESSTNTDPVHTYKERGNFTARLTATRGSKSASVVENLTVGDAYFSRIDVDVPSGKTPNGEEINSLTVEFAAIGVEMAKKEPIHFPHTFYVSGDISMKPGTHPIRIILGETSGISTHSEVIELVSDAGTDVIHGQNATGSIKLAAYRKVR